MCAYIYVYIYIYVSAPGSIRNVLNKKRKQKPNKKYEKNMNP